MSGVIQWITYGDAAVRATLMFILVVLASLAWGGYLQVDAAPSSRAALRARGTAWLRIGWLGFIGSVLILLGARGMGIPALTLLSDIIATGFYLCVFLQGVEAMEVRNAPAAPQ